MTSALRAVAEAILAVPLEDIAALEAAMEGWDFDEGRAALVGFASELLGRTEWDDEAKRWVEPSEQGDAPIGDDGQPDAEATGDEWDWASAGKGWREPFQSGVNAAARALADEGTLLPLPLGGNSPQGLDWWSKRTFHHLKHGKHKKSTKRALRSWLAYAASKGVYPSVGDAA